MKTRFFLMAAAALLFASCSEAETENGTQDDGSAVTGVQQYSGSMVVTYEGEEYSTNDIVVEVTFSEDGSSMDIKMLKVKFVPQMPVTLDVLIPGVSTDGSSPDSGTVTFSGDDIIPYMANGAYDRFIVNDLTGKLENGNISFSLYFGDYPTSYSGTVLE